MIFSPAHLFFNSKKTKAMSLVLTRTQNMRANSNLDKFELRPSRYGALNAFIDQSNDPNGILTPELKEKARVSIGSTLDISTQSRLLKSVRR